MAGQQPLELRIEVRVLVPQLFFVKTHLSNQKLICEFRIVIYAPTPNTNSLCLVFFV